MVARRHSLTTFCANPKNLSCRSDLPRQPSRPAFTTHRTTIRLARSLRLSGQRPRKMTLKCGSRFYTFVPARQMLEIRSIDAVDAEPAACISAQYDIGQGKCIVFDKPAAGQMRVEYRPLFGDIRHIGSNLRFVARLGGGTHHRPEYGP